MRVLYGSLMALSTLLFVLGIVVMVFASLAMVLSLVPADRGGQLYTSGIGLVVIAYVGFHGGQASRPR